MDMRALLLDLFETYYDAIAAGYDTDIWWWTREVRQLKAEHHLLRDEVRWLVKRINQFIKRVEGKGCYRLYVSGVR